jgi:hypothetical protein
MRRSKKDGFCFKIYHPQGKSIYATKRVQNSLPINDDYLVIRALNATEGQLWIKAIKKVCEGAVSVDFGSHENITECILTEDSENEISVELSDSDNEVLMTLYIEKDEPRNLSITDPGCITDTLDDQKRKEIWDCLRELSPGDFISIDRLPSFIYEPRSLLERISDFYYHVDILSLAAQDVDSLQRVIKVTSWFFSGLYFKSKYGVASPLIPITGELYRCVFSHPDQTKTHFVAEQLSSSPSTSAWFLSNRKHGFFVNGNLTGRAPFSGNFITLELAGQLNVRFVRFNEDYVITFPDMCIKDYFYYEGAITGSLHARISGSLWDHVQK